MATVVSQVPLIQEDASTLARKRRREIRLSQRAATQTITSIDVVLVPDVPVSTCEPATKKLKKEESSTKIPTVTSQVVTNTKKKKPQMKYDPDVPMTKEEAAVWRREQRRKRNRESAAASRQRQRDRISELELELDEWKSKYEDILTKIAAAEEITKMKVTDDLIDSLPIVSPVSPITNLAVVSSSITGKIPDSEATVVSDSESEKEHDNNKMISRQASSRITT